LIVENEDEAGVGSEKLVRVVGLGRLGTRMVVVLGVVGGRVCVSLPACSRAAPAAPDPDASSRGRRPTDPRGSLAATGRVGGRGAAALRRR
jgi:hypothetical protein